jgi:hypothetical protein
VQHAAQCIPGTGEQEEHLLLLWSFIGWWLLLDNCMSMMAACAGDVCHMWCSIMHLMSDTALVDLWVQQHKKKNSATAAEHHGPCTCKQQHGLNHLVKNGDFVDLLLIAAVAGHWQPTC